MFKTRGISNDNGRMLWIVFGCLMCIFFISFAYLFFGVKMPARAVAMRHDIMVQDLNLLTSAIRSMARKERGYDWLSDGDNPISIAVKAEYAERFGEEVEALSKMGNPLKHDMAYYNILKSDDVGITLYYFHPNDYEDTESFPVRYRMKNDREQEFFSVIEPGELSERNLEGLVDIFRTGTPGEI